MIKVDLSVYPTLETARLLLRRLEPADEAEIFALRNDDEVNRYIGRPPTTTTAEAAAFIQKIIAAISENKSLYWAITEKGNDKLTGTICIWNIDEENEKAETGYELMPAYQGKGFMKEALEAVLQYGFREMKLKTMEAWLVPENKRSIALLEKSGFRRVVPDPDTGSDEIVYSLENNEIVPG